MGVVSGVEAAEWWTYRERRGRPRTSSGFTRGQLVRGREGAAYDDEHGVCVGSMGKGCCRAAYYGARRYRRYTSRQRASPGDISMPACGSGGAGSPPSRLCNPFTRTTQDTSFVLQALSFFPCHTIIPAFPVPAWLPAIFRYLLTIYTA